VKFRRKERDSCSNRGKEKQREIVKQEKKKETERRKGRMKKRENT